MRCFIERLNIPPRLQSQPNRAEKIFISSLSSKEFNEKEFFSHLTIKSVSFVIKIAKFSPSFTNLCEKNEYDLLWKRFYSTLGLIITKEKLNPIAFYTHDESEVSHFNLLRGCYYFHLSQQALAAKEKPFSNRELYWLNLAMNFNSIHAHQRYIQFLYQQLNAIASPNEAEKILIDSINLSKASLNQYGSYAYMMLSEAFFRYAVWARQEGNLPRTKSAIHSAVNACVKAKYHLSNSKFSIHNASLGEGLKASNTLGIDNPRKAILFLKRWAFNHLHEKKVT